MLALLFGLTLFLSASLLFLVQPLVGRMLLPALGGSPVVWNTCMVFFQAMLLLGYLYAHLSLKYLGIRRQVPLHLLVLLLPLLLLPFSFEGASPNVQSPILSLLLILLLNVGLPFFVVSTTAPLLQRWFSLSQHRSASDPYFLYAASNLGSLLALVAYPLLVEPSYSLDEQSRLWKFGYFGFLGMVALCGAAIWSSQKQLPERVESVSTDSSGAAWQWLLLGMIPSSLLLATTSYLTTDIAPIPLLWVIPLALYLLTFILAFSTGTRLPMKFLVRATGISLIAQTLAMLMHATEPLILLLPLHLLTFFLGSLLCHGWVAQLRPDSTQLTRFYLYLSLGGVLGGIFNTLLAPLCFHRLGEVEYPLLLVCIAAIRPGQPSRVRWSDLLWPILLGNLVLLEQALLDRSPAIQSQLQSLSERTGLKGDQVRSIFLFGLPLLVVYCFSPHGSRFAFGLGILFLLNSLRPGPGGETIYLERNSLGVVRVSRDPAEQFHRMIHGNTIHGVQRLGSNEPLSFYSRSGPVGRLFSRLPELSEGERTIGIVGLGTGSIGSYAKPNQHWHYFELDPTVVKIAQNEQFFTFLRDSQAGTAQIHLGDARLKLQPFPNQTFDLLILDAFSSDAIPIHLLTREAIELYLQKLKPNGVLLFHISNRTLELGPILERIARSQEPNCFTYVLDDKAIDSDDRDRGKSPSVWCLFSRTPEPIRRVTNLRLFMQTPLDPNIPLWEDNRINLWPVWKWEREEE